MIIAIGDYLRRSGLEVGADAGFFFGFESSSSDRPNPAKGSSSSNSARKIKHREFKCFLWKLNS